MSVSGQCFLWDWSVCSYRQWWVRPDWRRRCPARWRRSRRICLGTASVCPQCYWAWRMQMSRWIQKPSALGHCWGQSGVRPLSIGNLKEESEESKLNDMEGNKCLAAEQRKKRDTATSYKFVTWLWNECLPLCTEQFPVSEPLRHSDKRCSRP